MKFELYQVVRGKMKGQWRWRLRAANGEIIAHGESYKNRADCAAVVRLIMAESKSATIE